MFFTYLFNKIIYPLRRIGFQIVACVFIGPLKWFSFTESTLGQSYARKYLFRMNVLQTFSDPSQVPLSRLKQRAQAEIGNIRVQSTTTGFVGREGLRCEARPLDLFKSSQDTTRAS